jgi:hypothetical protein
LSDVRIGKKYSDFSRAKDAKLAKQKFVFYLPLRPLRALREKIRSESVPTVSPLAQSSRSDRAGAASL